MREDNRKRLAEKSAEELLDAALSNYNDVEPREGLPREGLEDRVLANLRQQSRAARRGSWDLKSAMIVVIAVLMLFAVDRLINHPTASVPASVAVSGDGEPRGGVDPNLTARHVKVGEREVVPDAMKQARALGAPKRTLSSSRRRDLALNLNPRQEDERAGGGLRPGGGLRIEEVRITEVRLDDIVMGANERQK
ncbi:MAG TPA: hypothetical protein VJ810_31675 [Blastocatellia bacterium]|nr:hypothetical protein [Blastocatellia bacterium]